MTRNECAAIARRLCTRPGIRPEDDELEEMTRIVARSLIGGAPYEVVDATLDALRSETDRVTISMLTARCRQRPVIPRRPALPPPEDGSGAAERPIYFPPDNGREHFPVAKPDERERDRMRVYYAASPLRASIVARPDLGITTAHIVEADARRETAIARLEADLAAMKARSPDLPSLDAAEQAIVRGAQDRLEALRALRPKERPMTSTRRVLQGTLIGLGLTMTADGRLRCTRCGKRPLTRADIEATVAEQMAAGGRGERTPPPTLCLDCRVRRRKKVVPMTPPPPGSGLDADVGLPPDELQRLMEEEDSD